MAAIDEIKNKRNPRKRLPGVSWSVQDNVLSVTESSGSLTVIGALDWNRTRFLEEEFWAWASGSYLVLDSKAELGRPPEKVYNFGPVAATEDDTED